MPETLLDLFLNSITFDEPSTEAERQSREVTEDPDDEDDPLSAIIGKAYRISLDAVPLRVVNNQIRFSEVFTKYTPENDEPLTDTAARIMRDFPDAIYHHMTSWQSEEGRIAFTVAVLMRPEGQFNLAEWPLVQQYDSNTMDANSPQAIAAHAVEHMALLAVRDEEAAKEMGNTWREALSRYAPSPAEDLAE